MKNIPLLLLVGLCVIISHSGFGQSFMKADHIPVFKDESQLQMPWLGGLNNPQFSAADLNKDGIEDLFVFDRKDNKVLTFLNGGTANTIDYTYAPEFQANFPDLDAWALLKDYNCDAVPDLFTSEDNWVRVFDGYYNTEDELSFEFVYDTLFYNDPYDQQFPVSYLSIVPVDIPAIEDINNDGDIDILTFNLSGGYLEYFENQSQELGLGCDTMIFEIVSPCFGEFYESGIQQSVDLDSCGVSLDSMVVSGFAERSGMHPGSTTLLTIT